MGEIDIWQVGFNAGELTPLLEGREDLLRFPNGCRKLRNAHGIIQGPARRRAGGKLVATTKDNGDAWLVRFVRSRNTAYMLEFGDNYIRFYRDRAQLLEASSPFDPYEVATPWTYADMTNEDGVFAFKLVQSNDILYICSGTGPIKQLRRFGDVDWDLIDFETVGGPFSSQNLTATTVYASADNGTVTLTASTAIFTADHVGALFRLQPQDLSGIPPWEANVEYELNDLVRNDGKTYKSLTSDSGATGGKVISGTRGPTHEDGSAADGSGERPDPEDGSTPATVAVGHTWEFQDPGYGVLKITAVGSGGTTATATVEPWRVGSNELLPAFVVGSGNATTRWAFGLYSDANGWPVEATFFRERFVMLGTRNFAFSVPALFNEFTEETAGQVLDDNAFSAELSSDQDEEILWAMPTERLLVGTTGGEHAIGELTSQAVFGPLNRKSEPQTGYGSRAVAPWRVGQDVMFVESSGLRIRAMTQAENFKYKADSQNDLAEHITFGGVIQTAWVPMPDNLFWCLTAEGNLPCLVYSKEQDVFGWSTHFIGGYRDASQMRAAKVRTLNTIPSPDGSKDDMWYIAERLIDGNVVQYIEFITEHLPKPQRWEFEPRQAYERRLLDHQADLIFLDSAATYDQPLTISDIEVSGAGVVTVTSTSHGLSNGDLVRIDEVIGMWEVNARSFEIENVTTHTFDLMDVDGLTDGLNGAAFTAYVSGGVARELVTEITGLDLWEGETLQVVTDGAVHPDRTVASGAITLQYGAGRVHTGYNAKAVIETQRPIGGNEKGSAQGKVGRIVKLILRLESTLGGKVGPDEDNLQEILFRDAADLMDLPPALFDGDIEVDWPDGQSTVRTVTYVQDQPLPMTVSSLGISQEVNSE